jgi:hypothetical protein
LINEAKQLLPRENLKSENIKINSLNPIMLHESAVLHLVCITTKGDRFYFSTNIETNNSFTFKKNYGNREIIQPKNLKLLHIKLLKNENLKNEVSIHESFYTNNVYIFSDGLNDGIFLNI